MKEFYLQAYPTDELGLEIRDEANFMGLLNALLRDENVYKYIGIGDSLVRERLFEELAKRLQRPYDEVHALWVKNY
jgi:hypothetical protein